MAITAAMVKELREMSGAGMMDCKKALTATEGDMDKALEFLREKGLATAQKKASRIAAEGIVMLKVAENGKKAVAVEVNAETDFVAKNDEFQAFVKTCAATVMEKNPADVEALLAETAVGSDKTIGELLQEKVLVIGENIKVRRFQRVEGPCVAYVHAGGKIGVIVTFETDLASKPEFVAYGKDLAMQIAALNTAYLCKEDVPAEVLEHEKKIMTEQVINEGKPANIAEKIVMGKIGKYYKENCLLDQEFVKDNKQNIQQYTNATAKALGGSIKVTGFIRYEKGDGIEKRQDDFAAEVASMVK